MRATVQRPSPYQAKTNGVIYEIVLDGTLIESFLVTKMVRRIRSMAKKTIDPKVRKWQWRVLIHTVIAKADLEMWLYRNFPETNPARVSRAQVLADQEREDAAYVQSMNEFARKRS